MNSHWLVDAPVVAASAFSVTGNIVRTIRESEAAGREGPQRVMAVAQAEKLCVLRETRAVRTRRSCSVAAEGRRDRVAY